jgi:membrane fusion protein (multidrug efflux system)
VVAERNLWVEANFNEGDLTYVRIGQPVRIRVDTFPGREWQGRVESLSPASGAEFAILPPQNATGNWVKIVQRVPVRIRFAEASEDTPLRAGLSAWVEIDTGHRRELPGRRR